MGKGLLGVSPHHTERQLLSGVALAGLLAVVFSCEDAKATLVCVCVCVCVCWALQAVLACRGVQVWLKKTSHRSLRPRP